MTTTEELIEVLTESISKHGHYHQNTVKAHRQLAHHLLTVPPTDPWATHWTNTAGLLWQWCQYGPIDSRRRLFTTAGVGFGADGKPKSSKEVESAIYEAIGLQIAVMSACGGKLHEELLTEFGLPCTKKTLYNKEADLFALNSVHLGDLFRYLSQFTKDPSSDKMKQTALECYSMVCTKVPACGLAWNQMAVLTDSSDALKSCYYYVKALTAGNKFPAALNNLKSLLKRVDVEEQPVVVRMAAERVVQEQCPFTPPQIAIETEEERIIYEFIINWNG